MPAATVQQLATPLDKAGDRLLLHDVTEREIPRPCEEEAQKQNYSGKHKKHTLKNALIVSATCFIVFVGATVSGAVHDKKIAEQQYSDVLKNAKATITLWQDSGYQGFAPEGVHIIQPHKKPKGKELTPTQKALNRQISSVRISVELKVLKTLRGLLVKLLNSFDIKSFMKLSVKSSVEF